jgi:hypothetical protein
VRASARFLIHFSEALHRAFGLQPSRLLAAGVTIITMPPDRPADS